MKMPGRSGKDLIMSARLEANPAINFVVLSGHQPQDADTIQIAGETFPYLRKPVDIHRFLTVVEAAAGPAGE